MFEGCESRRVPVAGGHVHVRIGGSGPALLFLHGYPQTHACWHAVAPGFLADNTCVFADLPGYGDSSIPAATADHASFSKRALAATLVEAMAALGHTRFGVLGHDRGARVAYRMALDHARCVTRLGVIEVIPTAELWDAFDAEQALAAYHWTFLAQPEPLPETLIAADPVAYVDWTLRSWTGAKSLDCFAPEALAAYRRQALDPARVHVFCEDYRAGAGIDRALDAADREAGRRIAAPMRFAWTHAGFPARSGDPLAIWRRWAESVDGFTIEAGHFAQEENPEAVVSGFAPFFAG